MKRGHDSCRGGLCLTLVALVLLCSAGCINIKSAETSDAVVSDTSAKFDQLQLDADAQSKETISIVVIDMTASSDTADDDLGSGHDQASDAAPDDTVSSDVDQIEPAEDADSDAEPGDADSDSPNDAIDDTFDDALQDSNDANQDIADALVCPDSGCCNSSGFDDVPQGCPSGSTCNSSNGLCEVDPTCNNGGATLGACPPNEECHATSGLCRLKSSDRIFLLDGGSLNGQAVNASVPQITIGKDQTLAGTIRIRVENGHSANAAVPIVYTPTWGPHETSFTVVSLSSPVGVKEYDVAINFPGPKAPGTYYLVFASAGQTDAHYVASVTSWLNGTSVWNDGNDLADLTEPDFASVRRDGALLVSQLEPDGTTYQPTPYGVTYVRIVVVEPGSLYVSGSGFAWRYIPSGSFLMGSPSTELGREYQEGPQHTVELTRPLWMKETEVTQGEYLQILGLNPSYYSLCGEDCPVEEVTWFDALHFANKLSELEGLESCYVLTDCTGTPGDGLNCEGQSANFWPKAFACTGYRLPTEAEWEYAARSGTTTAWYNGGNGDSSLSCGTNSFVGTIAWYCANSYSPSRSE